MNYEPLSINDQDKLIIYLGSYLTPSKVLLRSGFQKARLDFEPKVRAKYWKFKKYPGNFRFNITKSETIKNLAMYRVWDNFQ